MTAAILGRTKVPGFQIARRIGRGGMGEVLEAVRTGPGGFRMAVALKRLAADQAIRGDSVQRFFTEARILARLDHPNIVRVHDVLAVDAGYFIVMELLRGATLAELVVAAHRAGATAWPEVLAVADQALAGLAYAHAARDDGGRLLGLVHRDVTPRNLFVTDAGQVKLLDFGIAKLHERLEAPITREGTVHGTLELLSPEQAAGESADASTDIYQLGASIYWALAGRYPHGSGSAPELLARIINGTPRPLAELRPDLPAAVIAIVERAMVRERVARIGSAAAMRAELAELLSPTGNGAADLARAVSGARNTAPMDAEEGAAATESSTRMTRMTRTGSLPPAQALATTLAAPPAASRRRWRGRLAIALVAAAALSPALWLVARERQAPPREIREVMLTLTVGDQQPMGGGVSRDGTRLVYADGAGIVIRPLTGGRSERQAVPPGLSPIDAEFMPDGHFVALGQHRSGEWQLWRLGGGGPALLHWARDRFQTRVSPDGKVIACAHDEREVELLMPGHQPRRLFELAGGEMVGGMAWSPDGSRLAVVITAPDGGDDRIEMVEVTGAAGERPVQRTLHRRRFGTYIAVLIAWPAPDAMLYAVNDRLGASLYSLDLKSGVETPVHRWAGLSITGGRWGGGRLLCHRGTQRYGIFVSERGGPLRRLSTGDGQTRRLAGWSEHGWLFYANDASGNFDIVAHPPANAPALWMNADADEMPDTLVDGALIFQRSPGSQGADTVDLLRSATPGEAHRLASVRVPGMAANAVRCAGDRRAPCVVEDVDGGQARYSVFDPVTGTRGREIATLAARARYQRNMAVSADGDTLAVVAGGAEVALFDIASRTRRDLGIDGMSALQSVSWTGDGRLLLTGVGWRGHLFAALRVGLDGQIEPIEASHQRWYWRPQESPDGSRVALVATDFAIDLAVLEGL